jgi:predicted patatin/cPLA2 family phospholipase
MGLYRSLESELPRIDEWAGVSAGAFIATFCASQIVECSMLQFIEHTGANPHNFYPQRALRGERMFPHNQILRGFMTRLFDGSAFARLQDAAPVRILHAHVMPDRSPWLVGARAFMTYWKRRNHDDALHGPAELGPGLALQVVTAQAAQDPSALIDQLLWSSATPLVTQIQRSDGRVYLDGGLIDNVPVRALSSKARRGKVLVLLTRPHPLGPAFEHDGRLYLAPSRPVPVGKWDYTDPVGLARTFTQGLLAGAKHRDTVHRFLDRRRGTQIQVRSGLSP